MITERFHIILIVAVVLYLLILVKMLKERFTILKYTLLWLLVGGFLLIFAIFPGILGKVAGIIGIYSDVNFLFAMMLAFLFMISFSLTHIVSRLNENNKRLLQELAIAQKHIRDIEQELKKGE